MCVCVCVCVCVCARVCVCGTVCGLMTLGCVGFGEVQNYIISWYNNVNLPIIDMNNWQRKSMKNMNNNSRKICWRAILLACNPHRRHHIHIRYFVCFTCMNVHMHAHTNARTHTHTHTQRYMHMRISRFFWVVKREFPEVPRLIRVSYFLPAEGKMFSTILDTEHYRVQPNKSRDRNKITSLPTNPLLFNK